MKVNEKLILILIAILIINSEAFSNNHTTNIEKIFSNSPSYSRKDLNKYSDIKLSQYEKKICQFFSNKRVSYFFEKIVNSSVTSVELVSFQNLTPSNQIKFINTYYKQWKYWKEAQYAISRLYNVDNHGSNLILQTHIPCKIKRNYGEKPSHRIILKESIENKEKYGLKFTSFEISDIVGGQLYLINNNNACIEMISTDITNGSSFYGFSELPLPKGRGSSLTQANELRQKIKRLYSAKTGLYD